MQTNQDRNAQGWEAHLTIPAYEMSLILLAEAEAMELANDGRSPEGYALLTRGLARANEELAAGSDHGQELAQHWTEALDGFTRRYGRVLLG